MADIEGIKLAAEAAKQSRALLLAIKDSAVARGNNFVVRVGPVFVRIGDDRMPEACGVAKAHLFSKHYATEIADVLVNGSSEPGEAMHIADALDWTISLIDKTLADTADYLRRQDGRSK